MLPLRGNAWAEMKAREQHEQARKQKQQAREKMQQACEQVQQEIDAGKGAIPRKGPVMAHSSPSSRKSGLDLEDDLALPMPKPRRESTEENDDPVDVFKADIPSTPNTIRKRSVTEPARPDDILAADKVGNREKKKSRVASIKSKLSLRDLVREFRKDSSKAAPAAGNEGRKTSGVGTHDFSEEKLYIPKSRQPGVYSSSALLLPSSRDISFGQMSQPNAESCVVADDEEPNNKKLSLEPSASKNVHNGPMMSRSEPNINLDTLSLASSSPTPRAGEFDNTGQPHIKEESGMQSLRGQSDQGSPSSLSEISFYAADVEIDGMDYIGLPASSAFDDGDTDKAGNVTESLTTNRESQGAAGRYQTPVLTSPDRTPVVQQTVMLPAKDFLGPVAEESHGEPFHVLPDVESENHFFAGVTTRGGFAPPPPVPGYQNTKHLGQQLESHIEAVHLHMNNVVHRICKVFENLNNWTTDQIMNQTDSMADLLRLINARTAGQNQAVSDLHQTMTNVQCQLAAIETQLTRMETRMMSTMSDQINRLKEESRGSPCETDAPCNPAQNPKTTSAELQGPGNTTGITGDNERQQNKKKQCFVRKGEAQLMKSTEIKKGGHKKESEIAFGEESLIQHNAQGPAPKIPRPTTPFHPSPLEGEGKKSEDIIHSQVRGGLWKNPGQESSGSPVPNAVKLSRQVTGLIPENGQSLMAESTQSVKPDGKPFNEGVKTPSKKGVLGFRGTPYQSRISKEESPPPVVPPIPPMAAYAAQLENHPVGSSGIVHPALRNSRGRQIVHDREHLNRQLRPQTSYHAATTESTNSRRRGLEYSKSHQNLGYRTPTTKRTPKSTFAVTPSSSSPLQKTIQLSHPGGSLILHPLPTLPPSGSSAAASNPVGRSPHDLPTSLRIAAPAPVTRRASNTHDRHNGAYDHMNHGAAGPEGDQHNPRV